MRLPGKIPGRDSGPETPGASFSAWDSGRQIPDGTPAGFALAALPESNVTNIRPQRVPLRSFATFPIRKRSRVVFLDRQEKP